MTEYIHRFGGGCHKYLPPSLTPFVLSLPLILIAYPAISFLLSCFPSIPLPAHARTPMAFLRLAGRVLRLHPRQFIRT